MKQLFAILLTALLLSALAAGVSAQTAVEAGPRTDPVASPAAARPQATTPLTVAPKSSTPGVVTHSTAQPDGPSWYQVEVILFAQADSFRNEANLRSVTLAYPDKRVFLQTTHAGLDPELAAQLSPEDAQLLAAMLPEDQLKRRDPALPQAFVPLDKSARVLNPDASTLENSGTYQVLFHEAWMQPMQGAKATPWIIVQGGKKIGDHHELEGSLRFFVDSHLNAQTNLWRTRFGQPEQEGEAVAAEPMPDTGSTTESANPATDAEQPQTAQWPELPPAPRPPKARLPALIAPLLDIRDVPEESRQEDAGPPLYSIEDIDIFKHSQRINSHDLHYLDHPRLGMLIRLTPWVPPGTEAVDQATEVSPDSSDTQIIDEMNSGQVTDDSPVWDDEARD